MKETPLTGVEAAIRALDKKATAADLARALGITRVAVLNWEKIPLNRVGQVSKITGLPPHILRPDFLDELRKLGVPEEVLKLSVLRAHQQADEEDE